MKSMKYPHGKVALFKDRKVIYHLFSDCIVLSPVKSPRFMVKLVKLTNFDPKKCGNLLAKSRKMSTFSSLAANSNAWRVSFFSTHGGPVGWENVDLSHISHIYWVSENVGFLPKNQHGNWHQWTDWIPIFLEWCTFQAQNMDSKTGKNRRTWIFQHGSKR